MREFAVAAARADEDETEAAPPREFGLAGQVFQYELPSTGQISILLASRGLGNNMRAVHDFLRKVLKGDGYDRLVKLLDDNVISFDLLMGGDDLNEAGIVDSIVEEAVARPTESPTDSAKSQSSGGRRSTGRSPGKGSTASSSPPTDSST